MFPLLDRPQRRIEYVEQPTAQPTYFYPQQEKDKFYITVLGIIALVIIYKS